MSQRSDISIIAQTAEKYIGQPSCFPETWHGVPNPEGHYDCSRLVQQVLRDLGYDLYRPELGREIRSSRELLDFVGHTVRLDECRQSGDLLFYHNQGNKSPHVVILYDRSRVIRSPGDPNRLVGFSGFRFDKAPIGIKRIPLSQLNY